MLQSASADTKKSTARGNSMPQAAPAGIQARPVPALGNRAELRLQRKCDCGGGSDCDCDMGNDRKKKEEHSPRTALHRKPSGSGALSASNLLDAETQSFFEARLQRRELGAAAPPGSGPSIPIGAVDDPLEQEADQIADRVMRMPIVAATSTQQPRAPETDNPLRRKPASAALPTEAPPIVHEILRSPGEPLDVSTRDFFESRFGFALSQVRIHTDARAARSAQSVNAHAYTVGTQITFGPGQYHPDRKDGRRLLAHELAHVLQQGGGSISNTVAKSPARPGNALTVRRQPADPGPSPKPAPAVPDPAAAPAPASGPAADLDAVERILAALQEKQENGVGNFPAVFGILNGMWMAVMLPTIEEVKKKGFDLPQMTAPMDLPRVQVALAAVAAKTSGPVTAAFASQNPLFGSLPEPQQHEIATYLGLPWPLAQQDPQAKAADSGSGLSPAEIAGMDTTDRLLKAYEYADLGAALRAKLEQMIQPKQLVIAIVSGMAVFIGLQFTPVGWAADIGMLLTAAFVGKALSDAIDHLIKFAAAKDATTDQQLHQAGDEFAKGIAGLEIDTLILLITHAGGGGGKAAGAEPPPTPTLRFARLIGPNGEVMGTVPVTQIASTVPVISAVQAAQLGLKGTALATAMMSQGGSGGSQGPQPAQGSSANPTPTTGAKGVEIVDSGGKPLGEFDEVQPDKFIEDKAATGLDTPNPRTGRPQQTPDQWAQKQIFDKTVTRIENLLNKTAATRPTKGGSPTVPTLAEIKNIRQLVFRVQGATPEIIAAVQKQIQALTVKYPAWTFSGIFGS